MPADRLISVVGLGFGDCGKGLGVDALVRRHRAHTVVRWNGGAQAGHNVVLPDGRHHTFSQFGSGTFSPGAVTVLAQPVVVHPTALLAEAEALAQRGIADAFERLIVDPRCRVTTPFHQAAGRLREWLRGPAAHGSCGAGFGETVSHALEHADEVVHWGDLAQAGGDVEGRLEATRHSLAVSLLAAAGSGREAALRDHAEWRAFDSSSLAARWLGLARSAARRTAAGGLGALLERLARPGTIVGEGAQGLLLDERHGFHPHTTWSSIGTGALEAVMQEAALPAEVRHLGVVRSYLTRHGAGPFPTEDAALDARLAEPHNLAAGWQGRFRRGHPDAVLLRYAAHAAGRLDGLVVTHLDAFDRLPAGLRWCAAYRLPARAGEATLDAADHALCDLDPGDPERIVGLRVDACVDARADPCVDSRASAASIAGLQRSARLGVLLAQAESAYDAEPVRSAGELLARLEAELRLPVRWVSRGPTHAHVAPAAGPAQAGGGG